MDTLEKNEPLLKERSYVKSIAKGLDLPLRHPWGLLRHLWLFLLFSSLLMAVLSPWMATDLWQVASTSKGIMSMDLKDIVLHMLPAVPWGLLAVCCWAVLLGQTVYLMVRYAELAYFPALHPWQVVRAILPYVGRACLICIVAYGFMLAVLFLALWGMPRLGWALALFGVLSFLWLVYIVQLGFAYLMEHRTLLQSLLAPFGQVKRWGRTAAVMVVCGFLVVTVFLFAALPAFCFTYVGGLAETSVTMGDGSDLPSYFPVLRAVGYGLGFLVASCSLLFLFVPLAFHWGSEASKQA